MQIEGIPEGWELVRIGVPELGEWIIGNDGGLHVVSKCVRAYCYPIIRKIEKPKSYRPFASAEEFKPYRDKWWYRDDQDGRRYFPPGSYGDKNHGGSNFTERFKTCFFEDGTPFGVEVTE